MKMKAAWLSITSPIRKGRQIMTESTTGETNHSRPFEERVFARFDVMETRFEALDRRFEVVDKRLESMDGRLETLEQRKYDTKPIWEEALQTIRDTNERMDAGFKELRNEIGVTDLRVGSLDTKVDTLDHKVESLDTKVESINTKVESLDTKVESINTKVESLDTKVESLDTKVESLDTKVESIDTKVESIDTKVDTLKDELQNGLHGVERKIDVLNKTILELRADQRYVDSRLQKIETQAKPS